MKSLFKARVARVAALVGVILSLLGFLPGCTVYQTYPPVPVASAPPAVIYSPPPRVYRVPPRIYTPPVYVVPPYPGPSLNFHFHGRPNHRH